MSERQAWVFQPNIQADLRGPRALEYIAQYLDRIDVSLERVAVALEAGKGGEPLRQELRSIAQALGRSSR